MGSLDFDFPDDVCKLLEDIANDDGLVIECLESVRDITRDSVEKELHRFDATGEMANSVKCTPPTQNKDGNGYHIFARPTGYSEHTYNRTNKKGDETKYKVGNGLKAVWLQYGNSHQSPRPWLESAKANCEDETIDRMQEVINKRIGD